VSSIVLGLVFLQFIFPNNVVADSPVIFAGAEGGGGDSVNHNMYLGIISAITGKSINNGFTQRYYFDFYRYDFEEDETIRTLGGGAEGSIGYHKSSENVSGSVYIGLRYNYAGLSPDIIDSEIRDHNVWLKAHVSGEANLTDELTLSLMGSYTFGLEGFWSRGRLMHHLRGGMSVGPEMEFTGNLDYQAWKMGIVVTGFEPYPGVIVGLKAGIRKTVGAGSNATIGVEIVKF
jgi:hypothetical protein